MWIERSVINPLWLSAFVAKKVATKSLKDTKGITPGIRVIKH